MKKRVLSHVGMFIFLFADFKVKASKKNFVDIDTSDA